MVKAESAVADGHLTLLHSFKQCALHLCRGTVDFVGEYEVGKYRAFFYLELFVLDAVHHSTYYIGGEQVGSELDAAELGLHQLCQCLDGLCLGQSGYTLKQDMPVAEQSYEQ